MTLVSTCGGDGSSYNKASYGVNAVYFRGVPNEAAILKRLKRLWNWQTNSLWVWIPLWAFAFALLGGFLI